MSLAVLWKISIPSLYCEIWECPILQGPSLCFQRCHCLTCMHLSCMDASVGFSTLSAYCRGHMLCSVSTTHLHLSHRECRMKCSSDCNGSCHRGGVCTALPSVCELCSVCDILQLSNVIMVESHCAQERIAATHCVRVASGRGTSTGGLCLAPARGNLGPLIPLR